MSVVLSQTLDRLVVVMTSGYTLPDLFSVFLFGVRLENNNTHIAPAPVLQLTVTVLQ